MNSNKKATSKTSNSEITTDMLVYVKRAIYHLISVKHFKNESAIDDYLVEYVEWIDLDDILNNPNDHVNAVIRMCLSYLSRLNNDDEEKEDGEFQEGEGDREQNKEKLNLSFFKFNYEILRTYSIGDEMEKRGIQPFER